MNIEPVSRPLFSIVTVALNSSELLLETIESVVTQSCDDFEYIVIDGGSTDSTPEVLKQYSGSIDQLVSEPDDGVYFAMNKAIDLAKGRYLYFLNAGDIFLHEKVLDLVAHAIKEKPYDLFVGSGVRCSRENGSLVFLQYEGQRFDHDFFRKRTINHQCLFANAALFENHKFDTSYQMLADYDWLISKIVLDQAEAEYKNIGIVRYLDEGFSSQDRPLYLREKKLILKERFSDEDWRPIDDTQGLGKSSLSKRVLRKLGVTPR